MSFRIKKQVGPHETFFEVQGDFGFQKTWASWQTDGTAKKLWDSFWSFMSTSGLVASHFTIPTNEVSGKYEGRGRAHLTNQQMYALYQRQQEIELMIETSWQGALTALSNEIDKTLGAQLLYSDSDSMDRGALFRGWPPPLLSIEAADKSASEIVKQGAIYAAQETIKTVAQGATTAAGALGQAAGGAAASAAKGVIDGAADRIKSDGLKGAGGLVIGGVLVHRMVSGKWIWQ